MVDIVLADTDFKPRGIVSDTTLDWASGTDENDFELNVGSGIKPKLGWWWWIDGTEIGGRIDDFRTTVASGVYMARTLVDGHSLIEDPPSRQRTGLSRSVRQTAGCRGEPYKTNRVRVRVHGQVG